MDGSQNSKVKDKESKGGRDDKGKHTLLTNARCVMCKHEIESLTYFPFCSDRCRLLDLGKWASEDYRVPVESLSSGEDEDDQ